jgi:hypothetical protein
MADKTTDEAVLGQIDALVREEETLYGKGSPTDAERDRLAQINVALDRCWDLLRQRRALREFGRDPDDAEARPASIVEKYTG